MRITRNLLHQFARDTIKQRKRSEPDLHAAYLMGSLLSEDPLLGGTTDIDLMLVHKYLAPVARETVALTPEISLDIYHKTQDDYQALREFRQDPWMGYPLTYNHILLFDTDHWFEFVQSCVTADFHRADNVMGRVNTFLSAARDHWRAIALTPPQSHLTWLDDYLNALSSGANAIAGLIGSPLSTRRFMNTFRQRLEELGTPEVMVGFCGLLGCSEIDDQCYTPWIEAFEHDLVHLTNEGTAPAHLSPCRQVYYVQGMRALAHSDEPSLTIWPLLRTWLDVHLTLPKISPSNALWQDMLKTLSLTEELTVDKADGLDAYLDTLEELIEAWGHTYGV
jgi:hypothetical protein